MRQTRKQPISRRGAKPKKRIRLPRFGNCIGLLFEEGGSVEMVMSFPELRRVIDTWLEHEQQKRRPDEKTLSALSVLIRKARKFDALLVAEVPIAQRKAKLVPVFTD